MAKLLLNNGIVIQNLGLTMVKIDNGVASTSRQWRCFCLLFVVVVDCRYCCFMPLFCGCYTT